ncbi:MAG TPA: hypothetical protein DCX07_09070 [Phycisphaerales bacterium]|nr:hypothetical protein [Phycisphaerales bacterium]
MSMKVMIVDPDWRFAQQAIEHLESHAHLAVHELSAPCALERAKSWKPDLVIVASEVAESVIEQLYDIDPRPAILLTSWMDTYDLAWRAWQKGGDELLMKPVFSSEELQAAILTTMENAAAGVRLRKTHAA